MEEEFNILQLCRIIWGSRRKLLIIVFSFFLFSLLLSLYSSKIYKAEATIIPLGGDKSNSSGTAMLAAQLGMIPMLDSGVGTPSGILSALITSQTLAERLVAHLNILPMLYPSLWDSQKNTWKVAKDQIPTIQSGASYVRNQMLQVLNGKNTAGISISIDSENPLLSANLVNGLLEELKKIVDEQTLSDAKKNSVFIERQLLKNAEDLLQIGKEISNYSKKNNLHDVSVTLDFDPVNILDDKSEEKMNDAYLKLLSQKQAVENKLKVNRVDDVPASVYLEYLILRREVLQKLYIVLTQQYEMAKMEASQESVSFQVVDYAQVPSSPYKPNVTFIVMLNVFLGVFVGLFYIFIVEYVRHIKKNREN